MAIFNSYVKLPEGMDQPLIKKKASNYSSHMIEPLLIHGKKKHVLEVNHEKWTEPLYHTYLSYFLAIYPWVCAHV